jgi:hypothetical protein
MNEVGNSGFLPFAVDCLPFAVGCSPPVPGTALAIYPPRNFCIFDPTQKDDVNQTRTP